MKKVGVFSILVLLACGVAFAQDPSAKFAAVYADDLKLAYSYAEACNTFDSDFDFNKDVLLATMKMPSGKEILAGVSAESGILLATKITGKNGGSGGAFGWGRVSVKIKAYNTDTGEIFYPVPGRTIVLNARAQLLQATLGGVIEECTDDNPLDGTINVGDECTVSDEMIGLLTANRSANHFNFVFEDLPQGTYKIFAKFKLLSATFAGSTEDACAYALSVVALGDRIVTLQDVRAAKGGIVDMSD